jgi:hypothetical protein
VRDGSDLVLPVDRVAVMLRLVDGTRHEVDVFVPAGDEVRDLLESPTRFLPVREGGRIRLYAQSALMCVSVAPGTAGAAIATDEPTPRDCPATVQLIGGEVLVGSLRYLAPRERRRPADYLNEDSAVFALYGERDVHYIVKAHVLCVEEQG